MTPKNPGYARDNPLAPMVAALRRRGHGRLSARYLAVLVALEAAVELLEDAEARHTGGAEEHQNADEHTKARKLLMEAQCAVRDAGLDLVEDEARQAVTGKQPDWWPDRGRRAAP